MKQKLFLISALLISFNSLAQNENVKLRDLRADKLKIGSKFIPFSKMAINSSRTYDEKSGEGSQTISIRYISGHENVVNDSVGSIPTHCDLSLKSDRPFQIFGGQIGYEEQELRDYLIVTSVKSYFADDEKDTLKKVEYKVKLMREYDGINTPDETSEGSIICQRGPVLRGTLQSLKIANVNYQLKDLWTLEARN